MKITIDGKVYPSKKQALKEMLDAMLACEGSERERMTFAYGKIINGFDIIDTYDEKAKMSKPIQDIERLMKKVEKHIDEQSIEMFSSWAKTANSPLQDIVADFISDSFGVSMELATEAAGRIVKQ